MFGLDHAAMDAAVASAPAGAGGLFLLPYLEGERTPSLPDASGVLFGLNGSTLNQGHVARAAMEGVTLGMKSSAFLRRKSDLPVGAQNLRCGDRSWPISSACRSWVLPRMKARRSGRRCRRRGRGRTKTVPALRWRVCALGLWPSMKARGANLIGRRTRATWRCRNCMTVPRALWARSSMRIGDCGIERREGAGDLRNF